MRCNGFARRGGRRCIWAMRWRRASTLRCWRETSMSVFGTTRRAAIDRRRCRQRCADQGCIRQPVDRRAQGRRAGDRRILSRCRQLREQFFPGGAGSVSAAAPAGSGDGLHVAMAAGASMNTRVATPAYWVPASRFRRADGSEGVFPHTVTDRAKPGVIAVNASGKRFVNEALVVPRVRPRHAARRKRRDRSLVLPRLRSPFSLDLRAWPYQAFHRAIRSDTSRAAN